MAARKPPAKKPDKKSGKKPAANIATRPDDKRRKGPPHTRSAQVVATIGELIEKGHGLKKTCVKYSDEIGAEICTRIAGGESLNSVCRDEKMPHQSAVHRWILFASDERIHKSAKLRGKLCIFRDYYNDARTIQSEKFIDDLADISDESRNDYVERENALTGEKTKTPNHEVVNRSKLRVETRKWLGEVYLPKVQALRNRNIAMHQKGPIVLQFDKQDEDA